MDLLLSPDIESIPVLKLQLPLGACLDVPTGTWHKGKYGEFIMNGGFAAMTGIVGIANNFKSTTGNCMKAKAASRVFESCFRPEKKSEKKLKRMKTSIADYDTEVNAQEHRLSALASSIRFFFDHGIDLFDYNQMLWKTTDKTVMPGDEFFEKIKEFIAIKRKLAKDYLVDTPFLDRDGVSLLRVILPTFGGIDSLTDFNTEAEGKMMDDNKLGDSGANMLYARGGLLKTRLLNELPALTGGGYHYMTLMAKMNKEMAMGGGPGGAAIPRKSMQYLTGGEKIVGAGNNFTYATSITWNAFDAKPLLDGNRMPEYQHPNSPALTMGDTDLNIVKLKCLRNKNGPTGMTIPIIVTQREGIQFELTQFHYIREFVSAEKGKRPGIIGKGAYFTLALYPEGTITRNTLRAKIDEDLKLRTAIHYTSELLETSIYHPAIWAEYGCDLEDLYTDLKDKGYDWDLILKCRPYFVFNNDANPTPFLSSVDLLRMRKGEYHPYWMTEDKKGIKPEYQFEFLD